MESGQFPFNVVISQHALPKLPRISPYSPNLKKVYGQDPSGSFCPVRLTYNEPVAHPAQKVVVATTLQFHDQHFIGWWRRGSSSSASPFPSPGLAPAAFRSPPETWPSPSPLFDTRYLGKMAKTSRIPVPVMPDLRRGGGG